MLNAYLQQTQRLLNDPKEEKYNLFDLKTYVNSARGQVAGEGECIRVYATLTLAPPTQQYGFSTIVFPTGTQGVRGVLNVRLANFNVFGTPGATYVRPRAWEWFHLHYLSQNVPVAGPPEVFAQYGQGALGTLWFNLPDFPYVVSLDTVCYPIDLADDTTFEALPYLWTDAVPYYAAYLAMLSAQQADPAAEMFKLYQTFVQRARSASTPSVLPGLYQQQSDPFLANRLGISQGKATG
jgi:hypothetical protein